MPRVFAAFAPTRPEDRVTGHELTVRPGDQPERTVTVGATETIRDESGAFVPGAFLGLFSGGAGLVIAHRLVNAAGPGEPTETTFTVPAEAPAEPTPPAQPGGSTGANPPAAPDPLRIFVRPDEEAQAGAPREVIIGDGDPGYTEEGPWTPAAGYGGYNDTYRYTAPGSGGLATWTFDLPPGRYDVQATWTEHENRAPHAPYRVHDGDSPLGEVRVDQRRAPEGPQHDGVAFQLLGTFDVATGPLRVALGSDPDGYAIADAVRVAAAR